METELTHVARRETKSILRERGYPGMSTLSFQRIFQEMSALCPTVYSVISQMMQVDTGNSQDRKAAAMALMSCNGSLSLSLSLQGTRRRKTLGTRLPLSLFATIFFFSSPNSPLFFFLDPVFGLVLAQGLFSFVKRFKSTKRFRSPQEQQHSSANKKC